MKKVFIILTFLFYTGEALSQNPKDLDSLFTVLQKSKDKEKAPIYIEIANKLQFISPERTEYYAKEALNFAKEFNDTLNTIIIYRVLGGVHQYQSQYDSAIYYYSKSIEEAKRINNKKEQIVSMANIGNIYSEQDEFDKAISIFKHSLDVIKDTEDKITEARLLNNLGMANSLIGKYETSLNYLHEALAIKSTFNDKISYGITLSNIGKVYESTDSILKAENYYFKALNIFNDNKSTYNTAFVNFRLANLFFKAHNYDKSYLYVIQSIEQAKEAGAIKIVKSGYDLLIKYSITKNDYSKAVDYYDDYIKLLEDLTEKQNQKLISELEVKYETEIKEQKLTAKDLKLKQQKLLLQIIITILSIGIIFTFIILIQKRKLKTANDYLVKTNMDIVASQKELQELKVKTSSLIKNNTTNNEDESLINIIKRSVEVDKLYLDPNLTIFDFAEILKTNKTYISNLINKEFGKNFNNYINEFRVYEACALMSYPSNDNYTINAIAEDSGFNSISTFNRSFKKFTGVTPSYFWDSIKKNR